MKRLLAATIGILAVHVALIAQQPRPHTDKYLATGWVIDATGSLVSGAEVHASPIDRGGIERVAVTDSGRFTIALNGPGRYRLFSFKDDKGYRTISEALFNLDPDGIPEIVVNAQSPMQSVVIRLRSPAASLTVKLVDRATGRPIEQGLLILQRRGNEKLQYVRPLTRYDKQGTIRLKLPSFPIIIDASAPDYETWSKTQPDSGNQPRVVSLAPNDTKEITIALHRKSN